MVWQCCLRDSVRLPVGCKTRAYSIFCSGIRQYYCPVLLSSSSSGVSFLMEEDGKEVERVVGAYPKNAYLQKIEALK